MKNALILLLVCFSFFVTKAQKFRKMPESKLQVSSVEKYIRFLASDELMGRKTGHAGNNSAARYIAEEFRSYGLMPANGNSYFQKVSFDNKANPNQPLESQNVVGIVEGSDPDLKNEYVILSAHFDHLGFKENHTEGEDYIFNGARDNAIGVAGLLSAAQSLAQKPAKRSVIIIAYTGEEIGLKGSGYYAENPLVPLKECIFNLNIDGAGYNDKTIISGVGIPRTGAEKEITKAVEAVGLTLKNDPVPELGLFDRSDNVRLAAKGIPAPTFTPGFTAFDEEIAKYYHKEADEADNLDFDYCTKFCKSYAYSARLIANMNVAPQWIKGDKYEPAALTLYH